MQWSCFVPGAIAMNTPIYLLKIAVLPMKGIAKISQARSRANL